MEFGVLGFTFLVTLLVLGLIFGSFLNVLVSRFPLFVQNKGVVVFGGRSKCDHCGKVLPWYELIPVVSFLILWGRCSDCARPIPLRYSFREIITAFLFLAVGYTALAGAVNGIPVPIPSHPIVTALHIIAVLGAVFSLLALFFIDLEYFSIPDLCLLGLFAAGAIESFIRIGILGTESFSTVALVAGGSFLFFGGIRLLSKGKGMGMGDVLFAPLIPLVVGSASGIVAILFSFWIGALTALFLIVCRKKKMGDRIPFGPFLALGTFLALFFPELALWLVSAEKSILSV